MALPAPVLSAPVVPASDMRAAVATLCEPGVIVAVVQPIVRPSDEVVVGYEALARMPGLPTHPPDWWLAQAERYGLRQRVEVACLIAAAQLGPPPEGRLLFVNVSPSTLADPAALAVLDALPQRTVVELTEQEQVTDYDDLRKHLSAWLSRGSRFAIDDTGAGYSGLRHVIELAPDFLKLDRELIRMIDQDRTRLALVRSIVAFAREVGTNVIAEGVETSNELRVLRDAGVNFVQGYLLARPGPPWPEIMLHTRPSTGVVDLSDHNLTPLRESLAKAQDARSACTKVADYLFRQSECMPSIYLERHGELRCIAQRGLWQVLDGMPGTVGITGRTWKTGRTKVVTNVATDRDYVEAIPGVVAEICVPIGKGDTPIGALNVDSLVPLGPGALELLTTCAELLADRLEQLGTVDDNPAWHRALHASVAISGVTQGSHTPVELLRRVADAAQLDSGALVLDSESGRRVAAAIGPLSRPLLNLCTDELVALSSLVGDIRSCYTAGDASDRAFHGTESLRDGGARAVVVLPLWARHRRLGTVILAHSRPVHLSGDDITPLEMLCDHIASLLAQRDT